MTDVSILDYTLPEELIAHIPADKRDASRLMVVNRSDQSVEHVYFRDIKDYLPQQAHLIRNNAMVLKARLYSKRPTGGAVECLLLRPSQDPMRWWCLLRPGKKLKVGAAFGAEDVFAAYVLDKKATGECLVEFETFNGESVIELSDKFGQLPLPPYIERQLNDSNQAIDESRYQTVYAAQDKKVAAAAPTAGLHFTPELIDQLKVSGRAFSDITLHVGLGTFQPISTDSIEEHPIHTEVYEIDPAVRQALLDKERPCVVVGTTSLRALEDYARKANVDTIDAPWTAEANIYIYPPAHFALADHLITNFHLPRTTLMCLVGAFLTPGKDAGIAWLKELYTEAIKERYRFYSYGDAMLIL